MANNYLIHDVISRKLLYTSFRPLAGVWLSAIACQHRVQRLLALSFGRNCSILSYSCPRLRSRPRPRSLPRSRSRSC